MVLRAVPDRPLTGVGLVRVSHVGKRDDLISPELQRDAISHYAAGRGIEIVRWVEALDESGSQAKSAWWRRLDQAVSMVEAGDVRAIVVWKYSRAARHRRHWAVALDRVEVAGGVLESATEQVDTTTSTGRLSRGILAELAAWEADVRSEQWKETHSHRVAQGLPHTATGRFGYVYDRQARCYSPDPVTGPALAGLYRRYAAGSGSGRLIEWLNAQGITTRRGNPFRSENRLLSLLDSGFGAGLIAYRGELLPGAHEPVISPAEWAAYQAKRAAARRTPTRLRNPTHPLSGLLRCDRCSGPMHAYPQPSRTAGKAGYTYFRCAQGRQPGGACRGAQCSEAKATRVVKEWLAVQAGDVTVREGTGEARRLAAATARAERRRLAEEIKRADAALAALTIELARRVVPRDAYEAARDELIAGKERAEERRSLLGSELAGLRAAVPAQAKTLLESWDAVPIGGKRDALRALIGQVRVRPGGYRGATVWVVPRWEMPVL